MAKIDIYNVNKTDLRLYIKTLEARIKALEGISTKKITLTKLTPEEIKDQSEKYFESLLIETDVKDEAGKIISVTKEWREVPTVNGLCRFLGIVRQTWRNYENMEDYSDIVKYVNLMIETETEQQLHTAKNPTGTIFSLKNNFGWTDKREVTTISTKEVPTTAGDADKQIAELLDIAEQRKLIKAVK